MAEAAASSPENSVASTNSPKTVKGILKHRPEHHTHADVKWDEMNILETYHPANKDYGHMKIDEPPTPYNYEFGENEGEEGISAGDIAEKLDASKPREDYNSESEEEKEDAHLSEKEKEKKNVFRDHRKNHYNEFMNVKKARELIDKELADLEDDENDVNMETK